MQRYAFSLAHKVPGGERKMAGCSFLGTLPPAIVLGKVQCVAYSVSKESSMLGARISRMLCLIIVSILDLGPFNKTKIWKYTITSLPIDFIVLIYFSEYDFARIAWNVYFTSLY